MIDELLISYLRSNPDASDTSERAVALRTISELAVEIAVGQVPEDENGEPLVDTYIWVSTFDEETILDMDGDGGLTRYRFDLECCSLEAKTAKRLGRAVRVALQGYAGSFGSITVEGIPTPGEIDRAVVESKDDDYIPVNRFTQSQITVVAQDLEIVANEAQDDLIGDD